ncbi:hypothetical protein BOX15_Mlig024756g1 [Macrostomum lignano]|uniref:Caspase family p20 domain-containing protein n=1 Tax=Macrostomum lignano TaxID=282301 RepID=A0A267F2R9_9PLAT|nr:hypothetical protein BOX15_Mlig024756g1 [Macrostomum lignano]
MPLRQFSADEVDDFYLAAGRGDIDAMLRQLDAGLDVDSATSREFHRTALMAAAMTDQAEAARLLMSRGAALDVRDRELGCTAALLAAQQQSRGVLRLLTEAGARLNAFNSAGYSALFWCIENNDEASVALLLEAGADPSRRNPNGLAPLHLCAAFDRVDIAHRLLEAGAEPDPVSCELHGRHTPLTLAVSAGGRPQMLEMLASSGADLEHASEEGTAMALARGRPKLLTCLESLMRSRRASERRRSSTVNAAAVAKQASAARRQTARRAAATTSRRPRSALPSGIYPCAARPRGTCLLAGCARFAHEFDFPAMPGSEERLALLTDTFSDLGLLIRPAVGLAGGDLLARAQRLAAADHSAADLLVCAFVGYGLSGGMVGFDGRPTDIGQLVDCFSPAECPSLAGKPKLFLFLLSAAPRARGPGPTFPEPSQADCLLAYACVADASSCGRLTDFLHRMRRALDTEAEHVDFGRLFLGASERLLAASASTDEKSGFSQPALLTEVRHSLDRQLLFR